MNTRVCLRRLVLLHLLAMPVAGCRSDGQTGGATDPSSTSPPTATAPKTPGTKPLGEECKQDDECASGFCQLGFDGADFSDSGTCVAEQPIYEGRPLRVEGTPQVAALDGAEESDDLLLADFLRMAAEEHASIAAFARTLSELMALGAPTALLHATQQALADEIHHAEACLAWVERLGGRRVVPGPLPAAVAPHAEDLAASLLVEVFEGGCVGETLAAHRALQRATGETGELATHFRRIAADEARHAALAFRTLGWLLQEHPRLRAELDGMTARHLANDEVRELVGPLLETALKDALKDAQPPAAVTRMSLSAS